MEFKCIYCGERVNRKQSQVLKYKNNYCSQKCKKLDQINRDHNGIFKEKHKNQILNGFLLCTNCLKYKVPGEFYRASNLKHRLQKEYFCKDCRKLTKKRDYNKDKIYKLKSRSTIDSFIKSLLSHSKSRSIKKGYDFNLTYNYLKTLYESKGGICSLTGIKMTNILGKGRVATNISIDRIDSSKGYVEGNIQLICFITNIMKQDTSLEEFFEWVTKIYKYNE